MTHWMGEGLNWPSSYPKPERMTMSKRKITLITKIKRFFMRFNMCKCVEPKYEVLQGVLSCSICGKPTKWEK